MFFTVMPIPCGRHVASSVDIRGSREFGKHLPHLRVRKHSSKVHKRAQTAFASSSDLSYGIRTAEAVDYALSV